ncbi:MAG: DUF2306 domain-containing protein [Pirellulaceae bacterium]
MKRLITLIWWLLALLVLRITIAIVLQYRDYFPPDFSNYFLLGRRPYFWGSYSVAFYVHLFAGPLTMLLSLVLANDYIRRRLPEWHRRLGKLQIATILLFLVPSSFRMAMAPMAGVSAGVSFVFLTLAITATTLQGWRSAVAMKFDVHRRWMWRTLALLSSAILLRLFGGTADVMQWEMGWYYDFSSWLSWLIPLTAVETMFYLEQRRMDSPPNAAKHSPASN